MISATCGFWHCCSSSCNTPALLSQAGEGVGEGFALSEPRGNPTGRGADKDAEMALAAFSLGKLSGIVSQPWHFWYLS